MTAFPLSPARWLLLAGGIFLLLDCAYLVSVKVTHMGVIVPALIGLAWVGLALWGDPWAAWCQAAAWRAQMWRWVVWAFALWLLTLLAFFAFLHRSAASAEGEVAPRAIVVLGSSTPNGQPSPALLERLKLAYRLAQVYPQAVVVASGGVDFRQVVSEAQAMGHYLQTLGLPPARILLEDKSTSTQENLAFSSRLLAAHGIGADAPLRVVTNDFHTLRAGWIARQQGLQQARTAGAPTPLYMRYNAWTREYFACAAGWLLGEF